MTGQYRTGQLLTHTDLHPLHYYCSQLVCQAASMKIAIVGSTGRTGLLCTQQLLHEGHTVHALCRSAAKAYDLFTCVPRALRHQLRVIEVPDFEVGALREAIRGCEAVIFAACGVSFLGLFSKRERGVGA